jgi:pyruvate/2-oxoglutarate dehydrogenase complex dihydrolipoamide dehydrogenase (E3) component
VDGVYAVGDVGGKALLTPVAIAAGRRLSNRLFGGEQYKEQKLSYDLIPSVVFSLVPPSLLKEVEKKLMNSHPTIGSIGMTEPEAKEKYGEDGIKVYNTSVRTNLNHSTIRADEIVQSNVFRYARRGTQTTYILQTHLRRQRGESSRITHYRRRK